MALQTTVALNDRMTPALRNITKSMHIMLNSFESVQRASNRTIDTQSLQIARRAIAEANVDLRRTEQQLQRINETNLPRTTEGVRRINEESAKIPEHFNKTNTAIEGMVSKLKSAVIGFASLKGLEKLIGLSDQTTNIRARLNLLVDDGGSLEELEQQIFDSANRAGAKYSQVADIVGRLGNQARGAFGSNSEIVAFSELLNKTFSNAGAEATAIESTMYNLTQSLSTGKLLGQDYRIIKQNAPQMIQYLREYYGVNAEELDKMVSNGEVTAQAIKNAMFNAADEINDTFNNMPLTWEAVGNRIESHALKAFDPILRKINEIANSERFTKFADNIANALYFVGNVASQVFDAMITGVNFVADNFGIILSIIGGIVIAFGLYNSVLALHTFYLGINAIAEKINTVATYMQAKALLAKVDANLLATNSTYALAIATAQATVAQGSFNMALLACPITWIIFGIIALITIISTMIIAINKARGESVSAIGVVAGTIFMIGAEILNFGIGIINSIISIIDGAINAIISTMEWCLNVLFGGFDNFGAAVANLIGNIISWFMNLGKVVTTIVDAIFGTNWTAGLESLQNKVASWGKSEKTIKLDRVDHTINRINPVDAYNKGYNWGSNLFNNKTTEKISDFSSLLNGIGDISNNTAGTNDNIGKIADSLEATEEELKSLVDLAERDVINRFTTAEIKIDFSNTNHIQSDLDLDGVVEHIKETIYEGITTGAEEVHA